MKLVGFIRRIILYLFIGRQQPVVRGPTAPEDPWPADDLPPGYIPIETQIRGQHLDGSGRWVGEDARVIQAPNGELLTLERGRTVRCGCGHLATSIEEIVTATGVRRGIGGVCHYCSAEAQELLKRNAVSLAQADGLSLYCSRCGSHCDGCGRQNLCKRHSATFNDVNGQRQLCPDCLTKANRKKFFQQTIGIMNWLLADDDKSSESNRRRDSYDH